MLLLLLTILRNTKICQNYTSYDDILYVVVIFTRPQFMVDLWWPYFVA